MRGSARMHHTGPRRAAAVSAILLGILTTPAFAITPVTPVGVESCDAFLNAYARCAASPGVPEAARPGIRQGINTMRESFRDTVMRNETARPTVAYQCAQAHEAVRKSLIDAFKCDFPGSALSFAGSVANPTVTTEKHRCAHPHCAAADPRGSGARQG